MFHTLFNIFFIEVRIITIWSRNNGDIVEHFLPGIFGSDFFGSGICGSGICGYGNFHPLPLMIKHILLIITSQCIVMNSCTVRFYCDMVDKGDASEKISLNI